MLDMIIRCGGIEKTTFVFFDTGLEYAATKEHIGYLEGKYGIQVVKIQPDKSIPMACRKYGVPFLSKYASEMIYRLQKHGFLFEDKPFEVLMQEFHNCKTALIWWCDVKKENSNPQFVISRTPYLKEFMVHNPPQFRISDKCCQYAKKAPAHNFEKSGGFDLCCTGIRRSEGGARAIGYKDCFSGNTDGADQFRPIFWFKNADKEEYCNHYNVQHSKCYTDYGLSRTGCFGCPFGRDFETELLTIKTHEPKLYKAANVLFGESYEYTRAFLDFRKEMRRING